MLPRPNPNHPSLSSVRGKSSHLEGREGTVLPGCGGQTLVPVPRPRPPAPAKAGRPPPAAGAGAAPRQARNKPDPKRRPNQRGLSRPRGQPRRTQTRAARPGSPRAGGERRAPGPARPAARRTPVAAPTSLAAASGGPGAARHHPPRRSGSSVRLRGAHARTRGRPGARNHHTGYSGPAAVLSGRKKKNATANDAVTSDPWRPTAARPGQDSSVAGGGDRAS